MPTLQTPSLEVHSLRFNHSASSHAFQLSEYTDSFIYVFNVVNGQLNELRFVIFMVNLKSRSCWLILLVDGKTRRNCRPCRDSNKHFMLNYSGLEQKEEQDFPAQWPGDPTKRSHRRPPQLNHHNAHPPRIGKAGSGILVQLVKVPGAWPQRGAELLLAREEMHNHPFFTSFFSSLSFGKLSGN